MNIKIRRIEQGEARKSTIKRRMGRGAIMNAVNKCMPAASAIMNTVNKYMPAARRHPGVIGGESTRATPCADAAPRTRTHARTHARRHTHTRRVN